MITVLERLIEEKGFRKGYVAERARLSPSALSRLFKRERPLSRQEADLVGDIIGVPSWLFFDGRELNCKDIHSISSYLEHQKEKCHLF